MLSPRFAFAIGCLLANSSLLPAEDAPPVPPELQPLSSEAQQQFEEGNYVGAEMNFRKLVARAPENIRFLGNLAVTLFRLDRMAEAENLLKKSLTIAPEDSWALRNLGIVYYATGQHDLARKSLEEAIRLDPKDAIAHNYHGINNSVLGFPAQAVDELKTAIANNGAYSDAYFNLAVVLVIQAKPDVETARGYYERALKLGATPDTVMEQFLGFVDENGIRTAGNPLTPETAAQLRTMLLARR